MEDWLHDLTQDTAIIVPTRSLASNLEEKIAANHVEQGASVWEAQNIFLWSDYLKLLWKSNRQANGSNRHLITPQQSLLLWTQVIEASRRQEESLTLLNVQQTAKAVQRSWKVMQDWQVSVDALLQDHVADTKQYIEWVQAYQVLLQKKALIDEPLLATHLLENDCALPFQTIIWYSYDLLTGKQQAFNDHASRQGVKIDHLSASKAQDNLVTHLQYQNQQHELMSVFSSARKRLEQQPESTIQIVIHDLQNRQAQVAEIAKTVFYPSLPPLQSQQESLAYRFSLGQPLQSWPAIEIALSVIRLLKNSIKLPELSFILRNRFLRLVKHNEQECQQFDKWLRRQRMSFIQVDKLAELYRQSLQDQEALQGQKASLGEKALPKKETQKSTLLEELESLVETIHQLQAVLHKAKAESGFSALSFKQWSDQIDSWLVQWGWSTCIAGQEMNSAQYQLRERWQSLLKEYVALDTVQRQAGMNRSLEIFTQMTHEAVFQPQASASPILISGVYEAIGQTADVCYVVSMDESYPAPARSDVFIPNRLLQQAAHPEATALESFMQSQRVMQTLLNPIQEVVISYAQQTQQNGEINNTVSPLFRERVFVEQISVEENPEQVELFGYQDQQGPSWPINHKVKGGSAIFSNQSNCEFKAFVSHQLRYISDRESEFGLDALDKGNVVHALLDNFWAQCQTQQQLLSFSDDELQQLIKKSVASTIEQFEPLLSADKYSLLQLETPQLSRLLDQWLSVEKRRPSNFSVLEREERRSAEIGGIGFDYIIDRLDSLDDGRTVIIDYKTGAASKSEWLGERIKNPQLPLYSLAINKEKRSDVSGIAFAKIRYNESKYEYLSEADAFQGTASNVNKVEQEWMDSHMRWPDVFEKLAGDFLAGKASVNPIDEKTCAICDLHSVCRVSQLRQQVALNNPDAASEENHD